MFKVLFFLQIFSLFLTPNAPRPALLCYRLMIATKMTIIKMMTALPLLSSEAIFSDAWLMVGGYLLMFAYTIIMLGHWNRVEVMM